MALQDLTPQLRTRLSRMERGVGWFVTLAAVLLVVGFAYYIHNTAKRRGWFTPKYNYQTSLNSASGLKAGDPVKMMGFDVGQITQIEPNEPGAWYGVTIYFNVRAPKQGYIWSDSQVKVASDFLGNRFLEITKGTAGVPTTDETTNKTVVGILLRKKLEQLQKEIEREILADTNSVTTALARLDPDEFHREALAEANSRVRADKRAFYTSLTEIYWLSPAESPALNDRLDKLVNQVEAALPNILGLTNQIAAVLANSANLTSNLNLVALDARPVSSNLNYLTSQLRGPGALGEWALGTNGQRNLDSALENANATISHTDSNLTALVENLARSLDNLAGITSNLNAQVQANTNILSSISSAVVDADELVQGLKRHWLLRSAFKASKTNAPTAPRLSSPRASGAR
ncbi:MAG: MlaD family protein [Verrucomicrobia bacterium]|jgi:ABC-type transporter Mla subunit MlaD|nr:MlaD family protein [Verrucomicrobiota bacterium]